MKRECEGRVALAADRSARRRADSPTPIEASRRPWLAREDLAPATLLFAASFALHAATAWLDARAAGIPLSHLAVYYDGHVYIEIAKSFPLPFSPSGPDYVGHAPGYPALVHLARVATRGALDWGTLALATNWGAAALACVAVYALARRLGLAGFWPALAFAVANPRWVQIAATAHSEPLAVLLGVLAFTALLDARPGRAGAWLALAGLARFPALLLGLPLAGLAVGQRRLLGARAIGALALPLVAFGLFHLYLAWRVPGFSNVAQAHQVFWRTEITWPFDALLHVAWSRAATPTLIMTWATLAAQLAALALGLRSARAPERELALWIAAVVGFHACLAGPEGALAWTRLTILAWPPTLLLLWPRLALRLPAPVLALACAALGIAGLLRAPLGARGAVARQNEMQGFLAETIRRLDADEPRWLDFGGHRRR